METPPRTTRYVISYLLHRRCGRNDIVADEVHHIPLSPDNITYEDARRWIAIERCTVPCNINITKLETKP